MTVASLCTILMSCASGVKKADIPSSANPQDEISRLESDMGVAVGKNIVVLASNDFEHSSKSLEEAKKDLASGQKQEQILDALRVGRGYLDQAYVTAQTRETKATGLFAARQAALHAGAGQLPLLRSEMKDVDSDVSSKADELDKTSAEKLAKLQGRYVDLERKAVILTQLGDSQAKLNGAQKEGAAKKAPITFKKSEMSMKTAESTISTNVQHPQGFQSAVGEANADAAQLMEVMNTIKQNGKNLPESVAIKMVSQTHQISHLKTDLSANSAESAASEASLQAKNEKLSTAMQSQNQDLANANARVEIQRVIEKARSQFSPDEAEAYQQGGNLLIRLKKINFASGGADLPAASLPLLAKVSEVAKSMNASEIKVEGHTDSVGKAPQNKAISEKRAGAVASYLKSNGFKDIAVQSEGYGFEKPIATNKSKEGRAQNRRVDIIITPDTQTHQ